MEVFNLHYIEDMYFWDGWCDRVMTTAIYIGHSNQLSFINVFKNATRVCEIQICQYPKQMKFKTFFGRFVSKLHSCSYSICYKYVYICCYIVIYIFYFLELFMQDIQRIS